MARLKILQYPHPALRRAARRVSDFDDGLAEFAADLTETLHATSGIGLSAAQVGDPRAVFVMDLSAERSEPKVYVNPEILSHEVQAWVEESCLSIPGVDEKVIRSIRARVRAQDVAGEVFEEDLEDMYAVCVQHEVDHLEGRLFIDRLPFFRRMIVRARLSGRKVASDAPPDAPDAPLDSPDRPTAPTR